MAQISRLKAAEITNGNVINADDLEAEFDQLVSESNDQDDRLSDIESNALTIGGLKTFTDGIATNTIAERTAGSGVTVDGVVCKDSMVTVSGTPTTGGQIGYASNLLQYHNGTSVTTIPSGATQSDQETATSTTTYVSPSTQHYHPSAVKAWAYIDFSLSTPAIVAGYNVASVTDSGTGKGILALTTGLSSATAGAVQVVASRGTPHTNLADFSEGYLSSATQVTFGIYDGAGYYDAPYVYIFVVGDMA